MNFHNQIIPFGKSNPQLSHVETIKSAGILEKTECPEQNSHDNLARISPMNHVAYNKISFASSDNVDVKFYNINKTKEAMFKEYSPRMTQIINDIKVRVGKTGQFLNWIGLPKSQLQNVDKLYEMANDAKKDNSDKLVVIGIGGSRHTNENMTNLLGVNDKVKFFSAVDSESFNRFFKDVDLKRTKFLVVSKSGGTLETMSGYKKVKKLLEEKLGKEVAKTRFIAITDKSSKSKLRQIATEENYPSALVHDDVGGRFSTFDDATIFTLAYAGISKEDTKELLKGAQRAQENFMSTDLKRNKAAQQAIFNAITKKDTGRGKQFVAYFSNVFKDSPDWETQLKNESLKYNLDTNSAVGPHFLHYNTERDLASENKDSSYQFITIKTEDPEYKALANGSMKAYSKLNPLSHIELKNIEPATIGEFIELKHFETLYTGSLLRDQNASRSDVLPEVVQFNVQKYKDIVKDELKNQSN